MSIIIMLLNYWFINLWFGERYVIWILNLCGIGNLTLYSLMMMMMISDGNERFVRNYTYIDIEWELQEFEWQKLFKNKIISIICMLWINIVLTQHLDCTGTSLWLVDRILWFLLLGDLWFFFILWEPDNHCNIFLWESIWSLWYTLNGNH